MTGRRRLHAELGGQALLVRALKPLRCEASGEADQAAWEIRASELISLEILDPRSVLCERRRCQISGLAGKEALLFNLP